MITQFHFYTFRDGRDVTGYRIENASGEYAVVLNYGAMIQKICVRDAKGCIGDVVLGPCEDDFENGKFSGSVMGRCANRIAFGRFEIDGREYQLNTVNQKPGAPHHLHGGRGSLAARFYNAEFNSDGQTVTFSCLDRGEDGWECSADVRITYTFGDDHGLVIDYELKAGGDTVLSPTNHVHFNLDMPKPVSQDLLTVFTEWYAPADAELGMPVGLISRVDGLPIDFTHRRSIQEAVDADVSGFLGKRPRFDLCYLLEENSAASEKFGRHREERAPDVSAPAHHAPASGLGLARAAELVSPSNGRTLNVYTDAEGLILCTPNMPHPMTFKGMEFDGFMAICLETQFVPNAVNCPEYRSPIFRKGETMRSRTVYQFGTVQDPEEISET